MGKYISQTQKDEVLFAIKNGLKVSDAATQFNIGTKAIYRWLRNQMDTNA